MALKWTKEKAQILFRGVKHIDTAAGSKITNEVKEYEAELEENGVTGLRRKVQEDVNRWKNVPVNLAVLGRTGEGKSSLINAFINASELVKEVAEAGIKETTTKPKAYKYPNNPNIVLTDLPGVGTTKVPKETYFKQIEIDKYDFFLLVARNRFTEDENWIVKEIRKRGKEYYFVRTNIDCTIASEQKRCQGYKQAIPDEKTICEKVRRACAENLDAKCKIFLVDNFDDTAFDFPKMREQLMQDLPDIKSDALALSFSALNRKVFIKKRDTLRKQIPKKALQITAETYKCEQKRLFRETIHFYQKQLGLDEMTLKENIDVLSFSERNIEEFSIVFDEMVGEEKGIFVETPTKQREKVSIWLRFLIFFAGKENKLIYKFSVAGLLANFDILYTMALDLHGTSLSQKMAEDCMRNSTR